MPARDLPVTTHRDQVHAAAAAQRRIRVWGTVAQRGDGYSGTYRNVWLSIDTAGIRVRVTASPTSALGTMPVGATVELAASLTGMVDLVGGEYYGRRAQLLSAAE
jgi:hypothetical protein